MAGFNKGEWSELYALLYLLLNPNLAIVDENLKIIDSSTFQIVEIRLSDKRYRVDNTKVIKTNGLSKDYNRSYIAKNSTLLLEKITSHTKAKGSFKINAITPLIDDFFDGKKPKGASRDKGDLDAKVFDHKVHKAVNLSYNIKSSLGSPATLLNASSHTNFLYEIKGIDNKIMDQINAVKGRKKLLNRCELIETHATSVEFIQVESDSFDYNLKMIDSNLDKLLAKILYLSYLKNEKDILDLLSRITQESDEYSLYKRKLAEFANAVTFGMRAGEKWNGTNEVNGGIIVITQKGEIYLLDLVYFREMVNRYLIENIKLDSPSSTRYKMFDIYKEGDKYYFKLNLQIRFK